MITIATVRRLGPAAGMLLLGFVYVSGCARMTYDRFQPGQAPTEYDRLLPESSTRRTPVGLCHLSRDAFGKTEAIVILLADDRRVAGKLLVENIQRDWTLPRQRSFTLRGEIDPELYDVGSVAPLDVLRLVNLDLSDAIGEDQLVREAHSWIAAGLVRLMQRFPEVEDVGVPVELLPELLERAPIEGAATLGFAPDGDLAFSYDWPRAGDGAKFGWPNGSD